MPAPRAPTTPSPRSEGTVTSAQDVLVHGAQGAIGSAAVQLLKSRRLGDRSLRHGQQGSGQGYGRWPRTDYTTENFTKDAQTDDLVLDSVGENSFSQCRPNLTPATSADKGK